MLVLKREIFLNVVDFFVSSNVVDFFVSSPMGLDAWSERRVGGLSIL